MMRVVAILLTLVLSACALYRRPVPPPTEVPERFLGTATTSETTGSEYWWRTFDDRRLNALIDEAFVNNPDIEQLVARIEAAEAAARIAGAVRHPRLDLNAGAAREKNPTTTGGVEATNYRLSLAASYEVDIWQRLKQRRESAELTAAVAREEGAALYLMLAAQVADLYYLAIEQRRQLELTERTIGAFEESLELVEFRYREGLVPALDVYQARQSLAAARVKKPFYATMVTQTEHALATLLGRYPEALFAGDVIELPTTPEMFAVGVAFRAVVATSASASCLFAPASRRRRGCGRLRGPLSAYQPACRLRLSA